MDKKIQIPQKQLKKKEKQLHVKCVLYPSKWCRSKISSSKQEQTFYSPVV